MDQWIITVFCLAVLIIMTTARLILGPTAPDRVIAVDTVNTLTIAIMVLLDHALPRCE